MLVSAKGYATWVFFDTTSGDRPARQAGPEGLPPRDRSLAPTVALPRPPRHRPDRRRRVGKTSPRRPAAALTRPLIWATVSH